MEKQTPNRLGDLLNITYLVCREGGGIAYVTTIPSTPEQLLMLLY